MAAFGKNDDRYLPSTQRLYELRNSVENARKNDEAVFVELKKLRKKVYDVLYVKDTRLVDAVQYFFDSWVIFSRLPTNDNFYLPPLYKSDTLQSILKNGIEGLIKREVQMISGSDNNLGHLVLGGVEGAGKTTLMRALALSAAALLQRMVPISQDYLKFQTPESLIWHAIGIYNQTEPQNSQFDPLDVLNGSNHEAFLLLDEFQTNFRSPENPEWMQGMNAANTFHRYSRTHGTFGIISGSSVDMHSLMFQEGVGTNVDVWRKHGYPNFNGTLYQLHTVPALRTVVKLKAYLQVRYPQWKLADNDISLLLEYTGGIGRWVHTVWEKCSKYNPSRTEDGKSYLLCDRDILQACTAYRKVKYEKFLEVPDNRELISYLLISAQPVRDSNGDIINCGGMERAAVACALTEVGILSPSTVIDNAQALSIIYIDTGSRVQFSRPADTRALKNEMAPAMHKMLLLSAVHLMVCGVVDASSGDVTDVNAGNALEEFVREKVYETAEINEYAKFYHHGVLSIKEETLYLTSMHGADQQLTLDLLRNLNLKHISWMKEHGLDGICFEEVKNVWYVDLWQCKGGRWDVDIGGGNNSMVTALTNFNKKHQLKDVGDKNITEILLKAQVGICLIAKALLKLPGVVAVSPRRLVITTTKRSGKSCLKTLKSWEEAGGVIIESDILKFYELNSNSKASKALKNRFKVRVEAGCDWVVNAASEPTLQAMARKLLPTTTTLNAAVGQLPLAVNKSGCTIQ
jgi:hypothetical protein